MKKVFAFVVLYVALALSAIAGNLVSGEKKDNYQYLTDIPYTASMSLIRIARRGVSWTSTIPRM